jgi:hypothetical protein
MPDDFAIRGGVIGASGGWRGVQMKSTLLLATGLLCAVSGFASTTYDNFTGYNPYYEPLGNPNTATYG